MEISQFEQFLALENLGMEEALDRLETDRSFQRKFRDYILDLDPDYDDIYFLEDDLYEQSSTFKSMEITVV